MSPRISVIIPTHNRPDFLTDALASVTRQSGNSRSATQLVVINDGHLPINEALRSVDQNQVDLTVINHGTNLGLAAARNTGLQAADGDFICFLDDDDVFLPNHFANIWNAAASGADLVITPPLVLDSRTWDSGYGKWHVPVSSELLQVMNLIPLNAAAIRASLIGDLRFDTGLELLEDWDFLLKLTAKQPTIIHTTEPTAVYYRPGAGTMIGDAINRPADIENLILHTHIVWDRQGAPSMEVRAFRTLVLAMYIFCYENALHGCQVDHNYYQNIVASVAKAWVNRTGNPAAIPAGFIATISTLLESKAKI